MSDRLSTAEKILHYFSTMDGWHSTGDYPKCESCRPYYLTAERLALAMRVLALVEARAEGAGYCKSDGCTYCPPVLDYCKHILALTDGEGDDEV